VLSLFVKLSVLIFSKVCALAGKAIPSDIANIIMTGTNEDKSRPQNPETELFISDFLTRIFQAWQGRNNYTPGVDECRCEDSCAPEPTPLWRYRENQGKVNLRLTSVAALISNRNSVSSTR
jgi:hypothetical protein